MQPKPVALDPTLQSVDAESIRTKLKSLTIGQDHAVDAYCHVLETFFAGFNDPDRPVGIVLALGPTGTGKTTLVENLVSPSFWPTKLTRTRLSRGRFEFTRDRTEGRCVSTAAGNRPPAPPSSPQAWPFRPYAPKPSSTRTSSSGTTPETPPAQAGILLNNGPRVLVGANASESRGNIGFPNQSRYFSL